MGPGVLMDKFLRKPKATRKQLLRARKLERQNRKEGRRHNK